MCMRESARIAHMPAGMSFEEAAPVCDGALNALWCLRVADLRKGRRILIYGASGAIGTAGVQLAKYFGADVTAVCNTKNLELVRSLGADRVIDYTQEDFTKNGETYDVIFDAVGKHSFRRCRGSLKPGGIYLATDGLPPQSWSWRCGPRGSGTRKWCSRFRLATRRRTSSSSRSSSRPGSTGRSSTGATRWRTWSRRPGTSKRSRRPGNVVLTVNGAKGKL